MKDPIIIKKENMKKPRNEIEIHLTEEFMEVAKKVFSYHLKDGIKVIDQEETKIIGIDHINYLLEIITSCFHAKDKITFFDNFYKHIVNQLIEKGWVKKCIVRPSKNEDYVEIFGPVIPCIDGKDDRYQIIYGVIEKDGKYSYSHPYDYYDKQFYPRIRFEKKYIEHLDINLFDEVDVWFYYGYSDDYYEYYKDGTDFVSLNPEHPNIKINKNLL